MIFTDLTLYAGDECNFDLFYAQINFTLSFSKTFSYMTPVKEDSVTWYVTADNQILFCDFHQDEYNISLNEKPFTKHPSVVFFITKKQAMEIRSGLDNMIAEAQ